MESVLARLQVRERDRVRVAFVDADDRPDIVRRLGVQEIPSIVMFRDRKRFACLRGGRRSVTSRTRFPGRSSTT
jgi:thioredoxin-like negative regulator of GroEL